VPEMTVEVAVPMAVPEMAMPVSVEMMATVMVAEVAVSAMPVAVMAATAPHLFDNGLACCRRLRALRARQCRSCGKLGSERRAREHRRADGEISEVHFGSLLVDRPGGVQCTSVNAEKCGRFPHSRARPYSRV
jgi:hypothetical protein